MVKSLKELKKFYNDPANWRPPSYSAVMRFMGWKSKNSVKKALEKINKKPLQK